MTLSPRALERRLKRHLLKTEQHYAASCALGFEDVLADEIAALPGAHVEETAPGVVAFSGPLELTYHANLRLRTAHRVLLRLDTFLAQSYPMLFNKARKLPWELYVGFAEQVSFRVSAKVSRLRHARNIADTLHAAMLHALTPLGLTPEHRTKPSEGAVEIHARLYQDHCTLSLNTSGPHLHKRGYKTLSAPAPLRETLAASLLLKSHRRDHDFSYDPSHDLILDPMCGTGTLIIEAALLARHIAPGQQRGFAFEHLPYFQASKWERFKREAAQRERPALVRLVASDIDPDMVRLAQQNARQAGVESDITFLVADARTLDYRALRRDARHPLIVSNPPYGRRLEEGRASTLLRAWTTRLQTTCAGWDYAIIHPPTRPPLPLTPDTRLPFRNGGFGVELWRGAIPPDSPC